MSALTVDHKSVLENKPPSPKAILFLAHGAGADMHHAFLTKVAELLMAEGIYVVRFNFPFMIKRTLDGKRRPPDRMPALMNAYTELMLFQKIEADLPIFIAGKSMGGRVAASLMSDDGDNVENVDQVRAQIKGVICLGYPFHPPKKVENLRLSPLQTALKPVCIIQGDRDALGNKIEVQDYQVSPLCEMNYLPDGDHDFKPRVKSGFTQAQHIKTAVQHMLRFMDEYS